MKNEQQIHNLLLKVDPRFFRNKFLQPATNVSVSRQVDHARWKTRNIDQNLQRNNVTRQVEGFCISYFAAFSLTMQNTLPARASNSLDSLSTPPSSLTLQNVRWPMMSFVHWPIVIHSTFAGFSELGPQLPPTKVEYLQNAMRASQETRNYLNLDGLVSRDRRAIDQKAFFGKMLSQFACREKSQGSGTSPFLWLHDGPGLHAC